MIFQHPRLHLVDTLFGIRLSQSLSFVGGGPAEITIYAGLLTHCNVEMRFGPLNFLVTTPELQRWHHSRDPREGDRNFGENPIPFDLVLGPFFCLVRRPPVDIGIDGDMPASFGGQLLASFSGSSLYAAATNLAMEAAGHMLASINQTLIIEPNHLLSLFQMTTEMDYQMLIFALA